MNGIHFLGDDDFIIRQGDKGLILSLIYDAKGIALVLFYSTECPYCESLIKIFKQLPTHVNGCQFAMINVNRNMSLVEKSKNTIAPISYVPDLILYVNGSPYVRYDGPHHIDHIKDFIIEINLKIKKMAFMDIDNKKSYQETSPQKYEQGRVEEYDPRYTMGQQPLKQQMENFQNQENPSIPAYTIGTPLYGERKKEKVCYLNFNNAYVST